MDLFEILLAGDEAKLASALETGASLEARNDSGDTVLIVAAGLGQEAAVRRLLEAGADLRAVSDFGFDALGSALWSSELEIARELVARGAEPSLDQAAALGDIDRLDREWATLPPLEERIGAFLGACRTGQVEVIRWFLERGQPIDLHPPGPEWGGIGCPGLHHAAVQGHLEAVRLLLERGADPGLVDDAHGSQALAWAASAGQAEVVAWLREAGGSVTHRNQHDLSAADLARSNGFEELARRLEAE